MGTYLATQSTATGGSHRVIVFSTPRCPPVMRVESVIGAAAPAAAIR